MDGPQTEQFYLTNDRQIETYRNWPMTADELNTSLTANTIIAKLGKEFQGIRLLTLSIGKHSSLDSDFHSGC